MTRPHQLTWAQIRALDAERQLRARMDRQGPHWLRWVLLTLIVLAFL